MLTWLLCTDNSVKFVSPASGEISLTWLFCKESAVNAVSPASGEISVIALFCKRSHVRLFNSRRGEISVTGLSVKLIRVRYISDASGDMSLILFGVRLSLPAVKFKTETLAGISPLAIICASFSLVMPCASNSITTGVFAFGTGVAKGETSGSVKGAALGVMGGVGAIVGVLGNNEVFDCELSEEFVESAGSVR